jgi:hypothetical protein
LNTETGKVGGRVWRRRFVVEELRRIGVSVHLAPPAETAGVRGPKKCAKGARADARHLRELVMIKRPPEWWIPPDHGGEGWKPLANR